MFIVLYQNREPVPVQMHIPKKKKEGNRIERVKTFYYLKKKLSLTLISYNELHDSFLETTITSERRIKRMEG